MSTIATVTSVTASTTSVTLLPLNNGRLAARFYNDANTRCRLKFGSNASATSFTILMEPGDFYEMGEPAFKNRIDAIWDGPTVTGAMRITEET